ncbi:MAG: HAMP domain-containing histidine kinase [Chloroflexi bacterium]|jgi:two-component system, OmpR family, sensor histidine kinase ArlS|nr:HAMP domain-containing histidine kinase [Chloroflexota bacterium]MBT7080198.1 HAMP domain-containing histidine kinase [Chloroflexota bacterium]MBT7290144.1 HAMP domain-containing histidine kinase [Chloroflexota bacterium]
MRVPIFMKTIRFRLTVWYAAVLLLLGIFIILWINLGFRFWGDAKPPIDDGTQTVEQRLASARARSRQNILTVSLISAAGTLVIGAAGGYLLSGRILKPVDNVASIAARISSTNLKERINHQGPQDEMKHLADTFDDMLARLDGAFEGQKQFIQDASHELKTPIAIALTNIEVMEMDSKATEKDYRHVMEVIKLSLDRLDRLSKKLLLLSVVEQNQPHESVVQINDLLQDISTEFGDIAKAAKLSIDLKPSSEQLPVAGDVFFLREAIGNLVDNAIKYSKPDTAITISAKKDSSQVIIEVRDNGIGIPKHDQQRIFDRFYRVEKSRSRDLGGTGLGLAVVKKIVENHKGTILLQSASGKGSTFTITLPLQQDISS